MQNNEPIPLTRDVEAVVIPVGTKVTVQAGEHAYITQSFGGSFTVIVNGNMFRIDGKDADALGLEVAETANANIGQPTTPEQLNKQVWDAMRTCYDPEIPVNIVDLGLIYDCRILPLSSGSGSRVEVKMTLTAPGCGMGPALQQDVQNKMLSIEGIEEAGVELVWEPQWNPSMMSDTAKLQLGLM